MALSSHARTRAAAPAIDSVRLWDSLMTLARIGATELGGVRRLALSELDGEGRDLVSGWLREAGCEIRVDAIGNIFAIRPGSRGNGFCADGNPSMNPADLPVAVGSHIDTQPTGGKFDGNYGVLAGLEVLRTLAAATHQTARPIAVAIWTNEEGTRFTPVMMGSGVYCGAFSAAHCQAQADRDGITVGAALRAIGYAGSDRAPRFAAYFEPHIEQGPVLERENVTIGAVEGALGQRWFDVVVTGEDAHAGPTPIEMRRDAMVAAARLVLDVRRIAADAPDYARGTVGQMFVHPNSRNVIPGRAEFSVDLRNARESTLAAMVDALRAAAARVADEDRVRVEIREVVHFPPCAFDPALVAGIERHAHALGHSVRRIASGAGHDAVYVARTCPAAMIFVPCDGGISHNEIENAQPGHLAAGCEVLLAAVLEAAG
ncbi:MAG: Zn-dependent hydrolase [Burkholderiaceae bacterium]|nr:Zn-dependent hydrolase [Burkholderiaceae bacterium]